MPNLKPLTVSVLFFALSCEQIFMETHSIKIRCYRTGKYTVCRRVWASFSPKFTCWDSEGVNHHRHGHHCRHYQRLLDHQRCFSPACSVDGSDDDAGDDQRNKDVHDGALLVVVSGSDAPFPLTRPRPWWPLPLYRHGKRGWGGGGGCSEMRDRGREERVRE